MRWTLYGRYKYWQWYLLYELPSRWRARHARNVIIRTRLRAKRKLRESFRDAYEKAPYG